MIGSRRPSWTALIGAFGEALVWALDQAAHFARHYPEEVAAIERVRMHMRARVANKSRPVDLDDVVFTFTLVMGALDSQLHRLGAFDTPVATETISLPHATDLAA